MPFYERLQQLAAEDPHHIALIRRQGAQEEVVTRHELLQRVAQVQGVVQGLPASTAIVPVCAARSLTGVALLLAIWRSGRGFAFINPRLKPPQVGAILHALQSPLLLADGPGLMVFRDAPEHLATLPAALHWWLMDGHGFAPAHQAMVQRLQAAFAVGFLPMVADPGPVQPLSGQPVGCCLFTSGSTGLPKTVQVGRADLWRRSQTEAQWFGLSPRDVLLNLLPWSFDVGLNQLLTGLATGCTLVLQDSWLVADILETIARHGVTGISATPMIWQSLLQSPLVVACEERHRSLRYVTVSGGDLPVAVLHRLRQRLPGVALFKTYGQSETFRSTSLRPEEFDDHPDTVGRPYPGCRVRVVRPDGTQAAPGEMGEIVHEGDGAMLGYLDAATPVVARTIHTGDRGFFDEAGYLHLAGRWDDLVKIADQRICLGEVTTRLHALAEVHHAQVVAVKEGAEGPTVLVAFVIPAVASREGLAQRLRRRLSGLLPAHGVPGLMVFCSSLPLTPNGKPDRPALEALAREHLARRQPPQKQPDVVAPCAKP